MNRLNRTERAQIIRALVEGNSIRSTSRMTGFAQNTIMKLLVELGDAATEYQRRTLRNLNSTTSSATRFGRSAMPSSATSHRNIGATTAMATYGPGPPLIRTPS
jgi:hypothetical protein